MDRLTKRHGKHAVQIGGETRRNDVGWLKLAEYEDLVEQGRLIEQKQGTWKLLDTYVYESDSMWQCSECKEDFLFEYGMPSEYRTNYCPNCGAKMVAEVELQELEVDNEHVLDR